jgi:hypothetical protein
MKQLGLLLLDAAKLVFAGLVLQLVLEGNVQENISVLRYSIFFSILGSLVGIYFVAKFEEA